MNKIITYASITALTVGLNACANKEDVALKPEVVYKSEKVATQIDSIPTWYMKMPESDDTIFSSGTATAPDMQLAVDIAIMNAKTTLADRINGKLDSMTKSFVAKIGSDDLDTSVLTEIEKTSKNVIASVDVAGYNLDEMDIIKDGVQYRAYVLLAYNNEEATKVLMNRLRKDRLVYSRLRSTEAWKELEKEVENSKKEDEAQSLQNIEKVIGDESEETPSI